MFRGEPPAEGIAIEIDEHGHAGDLYIGGQLVGRAMAWPRVDYDHLYTEASDTPTGALFREAQIDCVLEF